MSIGILETFDKQPTEVKKLNFDFRAFLAPIEDTLSTATVTAQAGLTIDSYAIVGDFVVYTVSGGTAGSKYKVTCIVVTVDGRTEEAEVSVKVKET